MEDVGRLDAVQDHVHDRDDVGEGLLFLPVKGALLQEAILRGGALGIGLPQVIERSGYAPYSSNYRLMWFRGFATTKGPIRVRRDFHGVL